MFKVKNNIFILSLVFILLLITYLIYIKYEKTYDKIQDPDPPKFLASDNENIAPDAKNNLKKCFYIASYHKGYEWQDKIDKALFDGLDNKCNLRSFYMDSKRNTNPDFISGKALEAHNIIQAWQPDIIIAADDNANKYLIAEYYKNSDIPVVFCGINWTADEYGYPCSNITGIIEIYPINNLISTLKTVDTNTQKGTIIYPDCLSSIKNANRVNDIFQTHNINIIKAEISSMQDFESEYIKAQYTDFIIFVNPVTITDWDNNKALEIVYKNSKVISIATHNWIMPYAMLGITNSPEEQGQYAANTTLKILDGTAPAQIPIISNRKWNTYINSKLLEKAGISLPSSILNSAVDINP